MEYARTLRDTGLHLYFRRPGNPPLFINTIHAPLLTALSGDLHF